MGLHLKVSTKALDQIMISDLNNLFNENSGRCPVHFTVYDPLDGVEVRMPSKTIKVDLNNKLFKALKNVRFRV